MTKDLRPLDDVDRALLAELMHDGRVPNNELARRVGIAESTCLARVRQLRERGAVRGIHADVDPNALGLSIEAVIAVRISQDARSSVSTFAGAIAGRPYVLNAFYVSGAYDYLLHVVAADTDGLRDIVNELSSLRQVAGTETHLVFEHRRGAGVEALATP